MTASSYIDTYYRRTLDGERRYEPLAANTHTDICVVGGGMAGLTTALELARRGHSVTLLEARRVAWGASGRNGGSVSPAWSANGADILRRVGRDHFNALFRMSLEGVSIIDDNIRTLGIDTAHQVRGGLKTVLYDNSTAMQQFRDDQERDFGRVLRYLPREELRELLRSQRYHQGLYDEGSFHFHPLNYAQALARECTRLGVHIHEDSPVVQANLAGAQKILSTGAGSVTANHVVFCSGGYTGAVVPALKRAFLPIATYIMLTEPLGERVHDAIRTQAAIGDNRRAGNYYRVVRDGRIQWGGHITTRTTDPADIAGLLRRELVACYPQLADVKIEVSWSGLMSYARHMMPQVGQLSPGVWHCTAFGGHGMNTTSVCGRVVAEAIHGDSDRYKLFAPFGLDWNGGPFGTLAVQLTYWTYQAMDRYKERQSR